MQQKEYSLYSLQHIRIIFFWERGDNVVILPGVTIGNGCVIGSNAVVTKDLPDNCIAVGIPAKVIKRYNAGLEKWCKFSLEPESGDN